jgi:hypothetical protein
MNKLLAFSVMTVLLVSHAALSGPPQSGVSSDEYEVYSALIREDYVREGISLAVITDETYNPIPEGSSASQVFAQLTALHSPPSLDAEMWDDFVARNSQGPRKVGRSFSVGVRYILVDYKAIEGLFVPGVDFEEAWRQFYKKYPRSGGYVRVSRVGFNRAKDQALVHTSWMCGQRCGEGKYVLLVRRDGKWKIESQFLRWVS